MPAAHHGGVQDAAKHAISAMSPLKSWLVEKPQVSPSHTRRHGRTNRYYVTREAIGDG